MNYLVNPFKNIFNFSGRASRKEFFLFLLLTILFLSAYFDGNPIYSSWFSSLFDPFGYLDSFVISSLVYCLYYVFNILPYLFILSLISLGCRRLHDVGLSGNWQWISPISFCICLFYFVLSNKMDGFDAIKALFYSLICFVVTYLGLMFFFTRVGQSTENKYGPSSEVLKSTNKTSFENNEEV